jgi:hypothetical protein
MKSAYKNESECIWCVNPVAEHEILKSLGKIKN